LFRKAAMAACTTSNDRSEKRRASLLPARIVDRF
jgi:hypothetical protein